MTTPSSAEPDQPSLRPATLADLPGIARCWYRAFFDDEIIGEMMHPNRKEYPEDVYWFLLRGIRERFWDWRHQFIVVTMKVNDEERIVGAADWRRIGEGGKKMELFRGDPRNLINPGMRLYNRISLSLFPNRAADPSRSSFLDTAVSNASKYWTGEHAECWDLYVCGVDPTFQGKGIGKLLVSWGTKKADEEHVSASVLCGEKNRNFYAKSGLDQQVGGSENGIALFRSPRP